MNDFGLVQLIWIKRLVSETARINTLIECNRLSERDVNRYKSVISAIDDFCAFVINSQNWRDFKNISSIVDEVFVHLSSILKTGGMLEIFQALLKKLKWFCSNISMNR